MHLGFTKKYKIELNILENKNVEDQWPELKSFKVLGLLGRNL